MRILMLLLSISTSAARAARAAALGRGALIKGSAASHLRLEPPDERDMRVLEERQLGHKMSNVIGCGARCKHGFAQAFAYDPIGRAPWLVNGAELPRKTKLESGLFRLSCPLLVKAIDDWEREGAVEAINAEVRASADASASAAADGEGSARARLAALRARRIAGGDDGAAAANLAQLLREAHTEHAQARRELIGEKLPRVLEEAAAAGEEQRHIADMVLDSGIAGQTRAKMDIKCVHAQLADHLCRSESNGVAAYLVKRLEERGEEVRGNDECFMQCDLAVPEDVARARWWYEPQKNKWKLRKRLRKRKERQQAAAAEAAAEAARARVDDDAHERELDRACG